MSLKNILLLGTTGVGKSTLINKFVDDAAEVYVKHDKHDFIQGLNKTTLDIKYHQYEDLNLIDCPGIFDNELNSVEKSCQYLEYVLSQIKYVDYVIVCISATFDTIRPIDKYVFSVLSNFKNLLDKYVIYITKSDLVDKKNYNLFVTRIWSYHQIYLNGKYHRIDIFDNHMKMIDNIKNKLKLCYNRYCIKEHNQLLDKEMINYLQNYMINYNLYSTEYKQYNNEDKLNMYNVILFGIIIVMFGMFINIVVGIILLVLISIGIIIYISFNKLEIKENIINLKYTIYNVDKFISLKLVKLNNVINNTTPINTNIYYGTGQLFYTGTMYGNTFNQGIFYNLDGSILYKKIL